MAVTIKSPREIELMREAGRILAITHNELEKALKPGISTLAHRQAGRGDYPQLRLYPSLKIITGIRRLSAYRSTTRWSTGFPIRITSLTRETSSVWTQGLSTRATI